MKQRYRSFYTHILNMFIELKETTYKKNHTVGTISHEIENLSQKVEIIKRKK